MIIAPFAHLRLERPLAVVDLEATGTDPTADRIVEVAVLRFDPAADPISYRRRVRPGVPIPPAATAVHGIGDADVAGRPRFRKIARRLWRLLEGCDLAGFNLKRFDLPLLVAEFARAGLDLPVAGRAVVDAMQIYHERERRDLAAAVRFYCRRAHRDAHGALADAAAAAAVLDAQVARYGDLPATAAGLHAATTAVDVAGRFRLVAGRVTLAFGKHAGRTAAEVAAEDAGYLRWLLRQGLLEDARAIVEDALGWR